MYFRTWLTTLIAGAFVLGAGCSHKTVTADVGSPAAPVKMAAVESRTVPVEIKAVGTVEAYSTISVRSQVTGTLDKVHFKEGDFVKEGDPLFEIDPRPYQEQIRQMEANIVRETAMLHQAEAGLDRDTGAANFAVTQANRARQLAKEGIFAQQQLDQAESDLRQRNGALSVDRATIETARASLEADKVALGSAQLNLSYCHIVSPVTGRTGNVALKKGNLIKATDVELVTIHQIHPIYVTFAVPEGQLADIQRQMQGAALRVAADLKDQAQTSLQGSVSFVDNAVNQVTGTIRLKGIFDNAGDKLWPGQFVNVRLQVRTLTNATIIPPSALQLGQGGEFVFVIKPDSTVEMRKITITVRDDKFLVVSDGVKPGENVVTDGQVRLMPGSKVKVQS